MQQKEYTTFLSAVPPFADAATALQSQDDVFSNLTAQVTAPVLYSYVWWCLQQALQDGVKTLYFLARDGHILYQVAQLFCQQYRLPLQCRYLFVSRMALRMPVYHRMGDAAYDLLLVRGANLTPRHVLERLTLSAEEQKRVYADIAFSEADADVPMAPPVFAVFAEKLRHSTVYAAFLQEKSKAAYDAAMQYLEQQQLFSGERIGMVDSGWNGSMQNCLLTLMQCAECPLPTVKGYYFGLYTVPQQGEWAAWYFDPATPLSKVIRFNNNVYECMCAAPHGTTMGYQLQEDGTAVPVCKPMGVVDLANAALAETQEQVCLAFTKKVLPQLAFSDFAALPLGTLTEQLLQRLLFRPTAAEATALGQFQFCDDMGECYSFPLAAAGQEQALRQCLLSQRFLQRFHRSSAVLAEPFWLYGSLACSGIRRKRWYHWNFACWDFIRHGIGRRRQN